MKTTLPPQDRRQTPSSVRSRGGDITGDCGTPSLRNESVFESSSVSSFDGLQRRSSPPLQQLPNSSADTNPSSVPEMARRVRSLVRQIREETEASLIRSRERQQTPQDLH